MTAKTEKEYSTGVNKSDEDNKTKKKEKEQRPRTLRDIEGDIDLIITELQSHELNITLSALNGECNNALQRLLSKPSEEITVIIEIGLDGGLSLNEKNCEKLLQIKKMHYAMTSSYY